MTIATKSGGIIVKDGKLAENCGCCVAWRCFYCSCQNSLPSRLNVTLRLACSFGDSTVAFPLVRSDSVDAQGCGAYSGSFGDGGSTVTGNTFLAFGQQQPFGARLSVSFKKPCEIISGVRLGGPTQQFFSQEFISAVVVDVAPVNNWFLWVLDDADSSVFFPSSFWNGFETYRSFLGPTHFSTSSPCYGDTPPIVMGARVSDPFTRNNPVSGTATLSIVSTE